MTVRTYEVVRHHKGTGATVTLRFLSERPQDVRLLLSNRMQDIGGDHRLKRVHDDGVVAPVATKETADTNITYVGFDSYLREVYKGLVG